MKLRILFTIIQFLPVIYIAGKLIFTGTDALQTDYLYLAYGIMMVFTLPSLIARILLRKHYIGTATAMSSLIYPILYILSLAGGLILGEANDWVRGFVIILVFAWNGLLTFAIWSLELRTLRHMATATAIIALLGSAFILFLTTTLRAPDSVLALDYLQHNTVVSAMQSGQLCILPGACSNLFLQQGYTTIYHSILSILETLSASLPQLIYILDLTFPLIMCGLVYSLMRKATHSRFWAAAGTCLALLVFVNGAYEFSFFLPQTFALLLALHLLNAKHTTQSLVAGVILLALSHFIMGTFLAVILIIKVVLIDGYLLHERKQLPNWPVAILLVLIPAFSIALNLAGFSVEKTIQSAEVEAIGAVTNLYSPDNIAFVLSILGFPTVLLIIAILYALTRRTKSSWMWLALTVISINLTTYFLAPTYANKFMMGFGIFAAMLIVLFLQSLKLKLIYGIGMLGIVITTFAANYFIQYRDYQHFYQQNTGAANAVVPEDKAVIDYLQTYTDNCLVISDPYTQIIIAGLTGRSTAAAQYMRPESRKAIDEFNLAPDDIKYKELLSIEEIAGEANLCYLYTSRMEESIKTGYKYWVSNTYSYIIDNNYPIRKVPAAVNYLLTHNANLVFRNPNFYLLRLADGAADKQ